MNVGSKYGHSGEFNPNPTREELERKTISQLLAICTWKRYNRLPFKTALIEYILKLGKIE